MDSVAHDYLISRGYTPDMVASEGIEAVGFGRHQMAGIPYGAITSHLAFPCRTPSGATAGIHLASYKGEKDYQWRENKAAPFLPICYASFEDWRIAWETREVILVEGVFDRVAVKRACPDRAVVARLSKSVWSVQWLLSRLCRTVWLAFDRDEEGELGANRAERRLAELGIEVYRLTFMGKDPSEHLRDHGAESLRRAFEIRFREELPL